MYILPAHIPVQRSEPEASEGSVYSLQHGYAGQSQSNLVRNDSETFSVGMAMIMVCLDPTGSV